MSKLNFALHYGTLDQAKSAAFSVPEERKSIWGHLHGMELLMSRMQYQKDPEYEKVRANHMEFLMRNRYDASFIVNHSTHSTDSDKAAAYQKYPSLKLKEEDGGYV